MKFSSVSESRQALRFKNISVKHQSQRAPVFWLKWSASECCPQKSECLNFQSSKTGLEKQNFNCDMMKYWVCFDDELALISHTSSELAEILMRWVFFFHSHLANTYFWFSAKKFIVWKKFSSLLLAGINSPHYLLISFAVGREGSLLHPFQPVWLI